MTAATLGKKIENYWYYHKWDTIIGVVILIGILIAVKQCATDVKPDVTIMVVSSKKSLTLEQNYDLEQYISRYVDDVNKDGKKKVSLRYYNFSGKESQDYALNIRLKMDLEEGTGFVFLTDDDEYSLIQRQGLFQKISDVLPGKPPNDSDRVKCSEIEAFTKQTFTGFTDQMSFSVRKFKGTAAETKQNQGIYDSSVAMLKRILENKKAA